MKLVFFVVVVLLKRPPNMDTEKGWGGLGVEGYLLGKRSLRKLSQPLCRVDVGPGPGSGSGSLQEVYVFAAATKIDDSATRAQQSVCRGSFLFLSFFILVVLFGRSPRSPSCPSAKLHGCIPSFVLFI